MIIRDLEEIVLRKLEAGLLDGIVDKDIYNGNEDRLYRKMIVNGTPWFFNFPEDEQPTKENVVVDGHWETREMKLFFLSLYGKYMNDPDAIEYSRRDREYPK